MLANKLHELLEATRDLALERVYRVITPSKPLPPEVASWRVAFCGASVGHSWRLPLVYPGVTTLTEYAFDKGPLVERALGGSPEAVVLKQCAAYFPEHGGEADRAACCEWVERIHAAGSRPMMPMIPHISFSSLSFLRSCGPGIRPRRHRC